MNPKNPDALEPSDHLRTLNRGADASAHTKLVIWNPDLIIIAIGAIVFITSGIAWSAGAHDLWTDVYIGLIVLTPCLFVTLILGLFQGIWFRIAADQQIGFGMARDTVDPMDNAQD
jgi:hypothetical protein